MKNIDAAKRAEYKRRYYEKCRAEGRCYNCGGQTSEKPDGGRYVRCDKCREIIKQQYYDAKQHGFCVVCGAKTDGYTHCKKCRVIARERLAERKRMEV